MKSILVVDDHPLIIEGLRSLLGSRYEMERASTLAEARERAGCGQYYACVLDLSLRGESGLEILGELASSMSVYILTMHRSPEMARLARSLGARGYFLKDESLSILVDVLDGSSGYSDEEGFSVSGDTRLLLFDAQSRPVSRIELLTPRERQVFVLLAEGRNYKEVAYSLGISPKTVNIHKASILGKMGAASVADLVRMSVELGLRI